ncbi:MAG: hypothetical protein Q7K40_03000 [bacterium]|nr:hypothetical protein [bacterium]
MKNWQQDKKIISATEPLIDRVKRYYGEDINNLTFGDLVRGIESIQRDFEAKDSIIDITQSELWKRTRGEAGVQPRYVK